MSTGEHRHCYCTTDTGGQIVCCVCGSPLEKPYDTVDLVLMWEQMGHDKKKEERKFEEPVEQNPYLP